MKKRTNQKINRTINRQIINKVIIISLGAILLLNFGIAKAETSVNMSAVVVERPITDTINDFDFSSVSQITPQVAGAQTQKLYCPYQPIIWQRILNFF